MLLKRFCSRSSFSVRLISAEGLVTGPAKMAAAAAAAAKHPVPQNICQLRMFMAQNGFNRNQIRRKSELQKANKFLKAAFMSALIVEFPNEIELCVL